MSAQPESPKQNPWPLAAVVTAALVGGIWLGAVMNPDDERAINSPTVLRSGTAIPDPRRLEPFSLSDHRGEPFGTERLLGRWTLLAFGYTHCPDVCPTILTLFGDLHRRLANSPGEGDVRLVFVSIDPERDTAERLASYLPYFGETIVGVTGSDAELQRLTTQLGVLYGKVEDANTALGYLMDHTASIVLIDPQGRFRAIFSFPQDAVALAQDLRVLMDSVSLPGSAR